MSLSPADHSPIRIDEQFSLLRQIEELRCLILESVSEIERRNISKELDQLVEDLRRGRYRYIDQSYSEGIINVFNRNPFDYRRRNEEFFYYFQSCAAFSSAWRSLLQPFVANGTSIIDLCPGTFPKIELGLHYLGYKGVVQAIDQDRRSLDALSVYQKLFAPQIQLECICSDLYEAGRTMKAKLVVANHILDDLVIDDFCRAHALAFEELYRTQDRFLEYIPLFQDYFDREKEKLISQIASAIDSFVEKKGCFILTQYPSLVEDRYGLFSWSERILSLLDPLRSKAKSLGYEDRTPFLASRLTEEERRFLKEENILAMAHGP